MKLRVRFKDGLSKIVEYDAPRGLSGYYIPHEFTTEREEGGPKVLVRSDPVKTKYSKVPVYTEVDVSRLHAPETT